MNFSLDFTINIISLISLIVSLGTLFISGRIYYNIKQINHINIKHYVDESKGNQQNKHTFFGINHSNISK